MSDDGGAFRDPVRAMAVRATELRSAIDRAGRELAVTEATIAGLTQVQQSHLLPHRAHNHQVAHLAGQVAGVIVGLPLGLLVMSVMRWALAAL